MVSSFPTSYRLSMKPVISRSHLVDDHASFCLRRNMMMQFKSRAGLHRTLGPSIRHLGAAQCSLHSSSLWRAGQTDAQDLLRFAAKCGCVRMMTLQTLHELRWSVCTRSCRAPDG
jgi:hypothetical protein